MSVAMATLLPLCFGPVVIVLFLRWFGSCEVLGDVQ